MKKILLSLILVFSFLFSTTYGYNMTVKDKKIIDKINKKIDSVYNKAPIKIERLYKKIQKILKIKLKGKEDTQIYVLINELNIHLEEILNKNKLNLEKKEIIKKVKNQYYIDKNGRKFKFYDIEDKSYLNQGFSCKTKHKYCKEMDSCSEATYYYKVCNAKSFDRDNDGIPCENICGEKIKK